MYEKVISQLQSVGLLVEQIQLDTPNIIRCRVEGDKGKQKSGWYKVTTKTSKAGNTYYTGVYGNWKRADLPQAGVVIEYDKASLTPEEIEENKAMQKKMAAQAAVERKAKAAEAAKRACDIWSGLGVDGASDYLSKKKVAAFGIRFSRGSIAVPVANAKGDLLGLQFINRDGSKKFLTGTAKSGAFHLIGELKAGGVAVIAEGYATAASIFMATGLASIVAFDAGNLPKVANAIKKVHPHVRFVFAADADQAGLKYARQAASKVTGVVCKPKFSVTQGDFKLSDFNDLHVSEGIDAVRSQILAAVESLQSEAMKAEKHEQRAPEELETPLPSNFRLQRNGLFYVVDKGDGKDNDSFRVCGRIEVKALARDADGRGWSQLLEFVNLDNQVCQWFASKKLFAQEYGSRLIEELLDRGLDIDSDRNSRKRLVEYLCAVSPKKRIRLTGKMGWNENSFISPVGTFGDADETYHYYSERKLLNRAAVKGSLAGWRDNVAKYCEGNPVVMFATSMPFAGPMLNLLGMKTIGFHLMGNSSLGKSSISTVAGSVCGGANYYRTWNTTAAALEPTAAEHSDSILILDEINQADAFSVGQTVYQLGNGEGKARATDTGGGTRMQHSWRLVWLSNGERSLKEIQSRAGKVTEAGMEMRLLHINADLHSSKSERDKKGIYQELHGHPHGASLSNHLAIEAEKNHGHAFIEFVSWLTKTSVEDRKKLAASLQNQIDIFQTNHLSEGASGQARRACMGFALVGMCGELATQVGITGWKHGQAVAAASLLFKNFLGDRGGEGNSEEKAILEHICYQLQAKAESNFSRWDGKGATADTHNVRTMNRWGFRKVVKKTEYGEETTSEEELYILPSAFRQDICEGFSHKRALGLLKEKGVLVTSAGRGFQYQKRIPGMGDKPVMVYFIKMSNLQKLVPPSQSTGSVKDSESAA